jgi:hypothetical protein
MFAVSTYHNFEVNPITHFDRLCKLEKRGDEIKKKSSLLKLLSQSQPNFAEMILGWSPFKNVSVSAVLFPSWIKIFLSGTFELINWNQTLIK